MVMCLFLCIRVIVNVYVDERVCKGQQGSRVVRDGSIGKGRVSPN